MTKIESKDHLYCHLSFFKKNHQSLLALPGVVYFDLEYLISISGPMCNSTIDDWKLLNLTNVINCLAVSYK
jgi:hypothetical protein